MYSPPPLRGRPALEGKTVLLIDANQRTREVRTRVLETHGIKVCIAEDLFTARFLWKPKTYDLILLDVRRYLSGEAVEFYAQIKDASPRQRFAFLVGPPRYISPEWPTELVAAAKQPQEWAETVKRFVTAA